MRLRHIYHPLFITLAAVMVLAGSVSGDTATAQGTTATPSSVWCGLWAGSNFEINDNCPKAAATNSASSTPTSTPGNIVRGRYVAMGDSVAAGLGLPAGSYTSAADTTCGRSEQGYPNAVAASLHAQLINVACSGATAGDLVTKQAVDGPNITAQLDTAFAGGTPERMSITAGANDVHWNNFIYACYVADCSNGAYDTAANAYMYILKAKLEVALSDIYLRSGGTPPHVVITGYYNPLSTACLGQQQNVTTTELDWITNETNTLNATIQHAAGKFSFVHYVPVDFTGHDICAATPWVQGQNDPAPFHPTAAGQQAMARAVLAAFRNQ